MLLIYHLFIHYENQLSFEGHGGAAGAHPSCYGLKCWVPQAGCEPLFRIQLDIILCSIFR